MVITIAIVTIIVRNFSPVSKHLHSTQDIHAHFYTKDLVSADILATDYSPRLSLLISSRSWLPWTIAEEQSSKVNFASLDWKTMVLSGPKEL